MALSASPLRPDRILKSEALVMLVAGCIAYQHWFGHHWVLFACAFLAPDLSLFLFLRGPNAVATTIYNTVHNYALPLTLGIAAFLAGHVLWGELSLIWLSHISFDRVLGYGLKYPKLFKHTHIQSAAFAAATE